MVDNVLVNLTSSNLQLCSERSHGLYARCMLARASLFISLPLFIRELMNLILTYVTVHNIIYTVYFNI